MPSSKKPSTKAPRARRRSSTPRKPAVSRKRSSRPARSQIVVVTPIDPMAATQPGLAFSAVAASELEAFATLLQTCKRAVGDFSDDQRKKLRTILGKAHRALERL